MKEAPGSPGRVFFPNLDPLRFFAFLAVFLYHSFETKIPAVKEHPGLQWAEWLFRHGHLGVNFFFVLSGFLITYLLLVERELTGRLGILPFYIRRALRIWPLYFAMVAFGFIAFPFFKSRFGAVPSETADPLYYLLFLGNFDILRSGMPDSSVLGVLWSLAVEEQFYLAWPLLLAFIPGRKYKHLFFLLLGGSLFYRWYHQGNTDVINYSTFSVASDMVVGAYTACLVKEGSRVIRWIRGIPGLYVFIIYISGFSAILIGMDRMEEFTGFRVAQRILLSLFFAFIIVEQNEGIHSPIKWGKFPLLSHLGKISYGLYCLHFIGILVVLTLNGKIGFNKEWWQVVFLETSFALFLTIVLSSLSYRFFERPFLGLKERFSAVGSGQP